MRSSRWLVLLLPLLAPAPLPSADKPAEPPVPAGYHTVTIGKHNFTLPKGFTIELVAESPQVEHPVVASFDDKGRLFVADSSGSNAKPADQIKNPTNRVVMLEADKDGKFTKSTVFADKLPFLEGCLAHGGSVYVATAPTITKLTDTDGDGVADKRETWFDGGTLTGCANDVHGPYDGPDGRLYWTKGGFAEQKLTLGNGKKFVTRAAHIYSAKEDGTDLRVEMTGGMDNPVKVEFNSSGEMFFTTTFLQHPANGKRDGIIHATYGAVYGKDHDPVQEHVRTRPELSEPMTHLGPAAPAGLLRYNWNQFGDEYNQNFFCAQFNMAKVSRHILKEKGATYQTTDSDFVTSDNRDFHPTDVLVDQEGSLLILDTGGWYKLCCPSSVMEKKDVLGAIYRVRKDGAKSGQPVVTQKPEWSVNLTADSLRERRWTAQHLGMTRNANAVIQILDALEDEKNDRVLDAALTRALIDIADAKETRKGFKYVSDRVRRATLVALEYMPDGKLTAEETARYLTWHDSEVADTAWWVASRHPNWGGELTGVFGPLIARAEVQSAEEIERNARRIATFLSEPKVRAFVTSGPSNQVSLRAVAIAQWKSTQDDGLMLVQRGLESGDEEIVPVAVQTLRGWSPPAKWPDKMAKALTAIARNDKQPTGLRFEAAAVLPTATDDAMIALAVKSVHKEQPAAVRGLAAEVLAKAELSAKQLTAVAEAIPTASPLDFDRLLAVFGKSTDEAVGLALVKALSEQKVRAGVRAEQVKPILDKYPKGVQAEAEKLYKLLETDRAELTKKLDTVLKDTKPGDVRRGQAVFNSAKAACTSCHKVAYVGGQIGPDLTKIGSIRSERDLLESIVFPSASFVRSYEPVRVDTKDGKNFNGILKADRPDEVVLTVSATEEVRIARKDIDEMKPGTVSVMPAGLDQQLSAQELADLVAFLRSLK